MFVYIALQEIHVLCGSDMDANLTQLVTRLEAVTSRLETVAGQGSSGSATGSQPGMDSGQIFNEFDLCSKIVH